MSGETNSRTHEATLRLIVGAGDGAALHELVGDVAEFCFKQGKDVESSFPEPLFAAILELLDSEAFLRMEDGHALLLWLEYDWAKLEAGQRGRLLRGLEKAYPKFSDWMCRFVASELLGEYFADAEALAVADRLNGSLPAHERTLMPLAFEKFARESEDPEVGSQAGQRLLELAKDPSDEVRLEAHESLRRLNAWNVAF